MASTILAMAADRWPVLAITGLAFVLLRLLQYLRSRYVVANIPMIGSEIGGTEKRREAFKSTAKDLYQAGYQKFKKGMFRLTTTRGGAVIVVSPELLPELRKLPDSVLSFEDAVLESLQAKYTGMETHGVFLPSLVKSSLTPALVRLNPKIHDEAKKATRLELPGGDDWSDVKIFYKLLRIVAMVSGRIFAGEELCHDEEYLDAAINYTTDLVKAMTAVEKLSPWQRWWKGHYLPDVQNLNQRRAKAAAFLRPIVSARRAAAEQTGYEKPDDMLQWLLDAPAGKWGEKEDKELAAIQLDLSFAAIHTTSITATNAFYNLAAMPDVAEEIREEARKALAENDNVFTSHALQGMKKLDSFLKETMRYNPLGFASFQRKVLEPIRLSNGQVIPRGVTIEVPAHSVNYDPEIFRDSDRFDPWRFYKLRTGASDGETGEKGSVEGAAQNQMVSVTQTSLNFGYGRHACPGRFFAANEIKMIVGTILIEYELKNAEEGAGRYKNIEFGTQSIPDPSKTLLFRKIHA